MAVFSSMPLHSLLLRATALAKCLTRLNNKACSLLRLKTLSYRHLRAMQRSQCKSQTPRQWLLMAFRQMLLQPLKCSKHHNKHHKCSKHHSHNSNSLAMHLQRHSLPSQPRRNINQQTPLQWLNSNSKHHSKHHKCSSHNSSSKHHNSKRRHLMPL